MRFSRVAFAVLVLSVGLAFLLAAPAPAQQGLPAASERSEGITLRYLRSALRPGGNAARVYYGGACHGKTGDHLLFPVLTLRQPSKGKTGLAAVREVFRGDKDVKVTEGRAGIIRIRIGKIPDTILQTRISTLKLKSVERYDTTWALYAVEHVKEVQVNMRRVAASPVPIFPPLVNLMGVPGNEPPHLPASMKDVTVDQVLDSIAKTFKGIVIYGACAQPSGRRVFELEFVGVTSAADTASDAGQRR